MSANDPASKPFCFDPALSVDANLEGFLNHLHAKDPELGKLFADNVHAMLPLPGDPPARSARRAALNAVIVKALDSPKPEK